MIELAIAMFIITLVLGAFLVPLTTQIAQRRISDTQKTLDDLKEALLGFAVSNGRLPCPAAPNTTGVESPAGGGACTNAYDGFVPGITLGLAVTDAQGYAIDAWGMRIRYATTKASWTTPLPTTPPVGPQYDFTTANGMRGRTLPALAPDLSVCATSTAMTTWTCNSSNVLTSSAPAVLFSLGVNATTGGGTSADEAANLNGDQVFVSRVRSDPGSAGGEFDDIVTWLSENVLYNRMVAAGQLP